MIQVQVRLPEKVVKEIDRWIDRGKFGSRSEAIRTILALYDEKERTREFYEMLESRSKEAKEHPEILIPSKDL